MLKVYRPSIMLVEVIFLSLIVFKIALKAKVLDNLKNEPLNDNDMNDLFGNSAQKSIRRNQGMTEPLVNDSLENTRRTNSRNIEGIDDEEPLDWEASTYLSHNNAGMENFTSFLVSGMMMETPDF
jgi:hypothetical protein